MQWVAVFVFASLASWVAARLNSGVAILVYEAAAQTAKAPEAHFRITDPADLSGERAESIYSAIKMSMRKHYVESGGPIAFNYADWKRYNRVPYRFSQYGNNYLNNYANETARDYGKYESAGEMPAGALLAKDSFIVTRNGDIITGPFFLMEKMPEGWNPATGDWRYVEYTASGELTGITKGIRANKVRYCATCHARVGKKWDYMFFMPKDVRVVE
ncbi:MAG: hypothetical protein CL569_18020 [Alphaproteobacteria bacterium]|nr:hypothetical protein [Alphaproteobacteria bacterium]|tara:strand:+ start:69 stop:716 length:648 start_codon:yes stop_codon:yes gene_type:complete